MILHLTNANFTVDSVQIAAFIRAEVRQALLDFSSMHEPKTDNDLFLNIDEAADFVNLKKQTLYGKVRRREIPVNKRGNRLYFSKAELTEWVKGGRKMTNQELDVKASSFRRHKK